MGRICTDKSSNAKDAKEAKGVKGRKAIDIRKRLAGARGWVIIMSIGLFSSKMRRSTEIKDIFAEGAKAQRKKAKNVPDT